MPVRRTVLSLDRLEVRETPALLAGSQFAVGSDAGVPAVVRIIEPATRQVVTQLLPFGGGFFGGVRVAVGDVTGDGVPDLVCGAGPGGGPIVAVYNGATGALASLFPAFEPSFRNGLQVAVGDVNGDGIDEIIAGAGVGGGPAVAVFTGSGQRVTAFFAYDPSFRGGVEVAAADTTGDGSAAIVTAPGPGGGPDIRLWDVVGSQFAQVGGFGALNPSFFGGSYLVGGDLTGDGIDEIIVGAGAGGGPQVQIFAAGGQLIQSYFAYAPTFTGGVRVGTGRLTDDGVADVLTVPGPGGSAQVHVYDGLSSTPGVRLFAFSTSQLTGAFVAGSLNPLNTPLRIPSTPADQVAAAASAAAVDTVSFVPVEPVIIPGVDFPTFTSFDAGVAAVSSTFGANPEPIGFSPFGGYYLYGGFFLDTSGG